MADDTVKISDIVVFGKQLPKNKSWYDILKQNKEDVDKVEDNTQFIQALATNIEMAYYRLAAAKVDVGGTTYSLYFDNSSKSWKLSEGDEEKATDKVDETVKKTVFKNKQVRDFMKRCYDIVDRAAPVYSKVIGNETLTDNIINKSTGDMNEDMIGAVQQFITDKALMKNFSDGTWKK